MRHKIPGVVIRRLVTYLRILSERETRHNDYISSAQIGDLAAVNNAQVRKDLALFGEFGKQGVGYPVEELRKEITAILGADKEIPVAVFGIGELGTAITRYLTSRREVTPDYRFIIKALYDVDKSKIGQEMAGVPIKDINSLKVSDEHLQIGIGIIAVPAPNAQEITNMAISKGVKAFLNFAPIRLKVPKDVRVHNTDITSNLQQLAFHL